MSPTLLTIFCIVFILLGLYNIYSGLQRMRTARAQGEQIRWYKQINLLTGIEYILLSLIFLTVIGARSNVLPSSLSSIIVPFYLVTLIAAAVLAGLVIRQGISNARRLRRSQAEAQSKLRTSAGGSGRTIEAGAEAEGELTPGQRAEQRRQRRERRQKAAAARRRRAGKA